jgi:hypothetical protein
MISTCYFLVSYEAVEVHYWGSWEPTGMVEEAERTAKEENVAEMEATWDVPGDRTLKDASVVPNNLRTKISHSNVRVFEGPQGNRKT